MDRRMTTESETATLVDGTRLTPQQLGLMGMEALETVVGYWEDALGAYRSVDENQKSKGKKPPPLALTTAEETNFMRLLESILEGAYQLQEESESIFIHQNSLLNRNNHTVPDGVGGSKAADAASLRADAASSVVSGSVRKGDQLLSVSSVDNESFVSAQDTIADLGDFEDVINDFGRI